MSKCDYCTEDLKTIVCTLIDHTKVETCEFCYFKYVEGEEYVN
jgi:hypothetical protein